MSLAGQYGKNNISFCAVNPGPVRTERWAGLVKAMSRDMKLSYEEADKLAPSSIPMGRIAEVEEVANLVVMLASPLMHMVNGTMIEIDGGQEKSLMDRLRDKTGEARTSAMKIVDLSHVMNVHTPGWVGYAGNKMYYAQNLQTQTIVAQRIDTALHVGTHFDGAMHATDGRKGDMASLPLDYLCQPRRRRRHLRAHVTTGP